MLCAYRELSVRAKPASQKEGFGFRLLCLSCHPCSVSSSAPRLSNHPHITHACLSAALSPHTLITTVACCSSPACFRMSSLLVSPKRTSTPCTCPSHLGIQHTYAAQAIFFVPMTLLPLYLSYRSAEVIAHLTIVFPITQSRPRGAKKTQHITSFT
jgi:hypothetical protein